MGEPVHTTFYPVDSDRPIRAYPRSWGREWPALSAALANHFGTDAERFGTAEASWNGDRDYAELVTLDGRIVGAMDRPLSAADVAAIGRDRAMLKRAFINRIRSLFNIDGYRLPELTREQQSQFLGDPVRFILTADEAASDAVMREVESRQTAELSNPQVDLSALAGVDAGSMPAEKPAPAKAPRAKKTKPKVDGQREMLLPIPGKKTEEKKPVPVSSPDRKAG
jgi:hypothetical protein